MMRILFLAVCLFFAACAPLEYKKADLGAYGGRQGYLDKKIGPDKFIIEVSHIGGYNYDLSISKEHWVRRAAEICPGGYDGGYEVLHPIDAKFKEFYCPENFCRNYPLVSGVIQCKGRHNSLLNPDTQHKSAASRQVLRAC